MGLENMRLGSDLFEYNFRLVFKIGFIIFCLMREDMLIVLKGR